MRNWILWLCIGIISLGGGVLALLNPLAALVSTTKMAGSALLLSGGLQGWTAWQTTGFKARAGTATLATATALMGILLLFGPFGDGTFLRYALAALLAISGAAKFWAARRIQQDRFYLIVFAAGSLSFMLGIKVLFQFPAFIANNLGVILGLELLANGATLVVLSLRIRKLLAPT